MSVDVYIIHYSGNNTKIKTITRENFRGLTSLTDLNLFKTGIEELPSRVFEDLSSLNILFLGDTKRF